MNDLQRDIGGLEARMDEHEKRFDRVEKKIDAGFLNINDRLDKLSASENRRKGAVGAILAGGALIAGVVEGAKALWGK